MNQVGMSCFSQAHGDCCSVLFNHLFQVKRYHLSNALLERSRLCLYCRMGLIPHVDDFVSRTLRQLFNIPTAHVRGFDEDASDVDR